MWRSCSGSEDSKAHAWTIVIPDRCMGLTKLLSEYKWKTYSGLHSSIIEATWETVQKFGKVYAITQCAYQSDLVSSEQALIRMWGNKEFETRASYIICWAPCTMKMKDLLFKKQEKVPSKVLCFFHGISLDSSYFFFFLTPCYLGTEIPAGWLLTLTDIHGLAPWLSS